MKRNKIIKEMIVVALFVALITVGTFIKIPMPMDDYLTLQVEIVILCGFILGPKLAFLATAIYVLLGLIGVPVFAAGGGFDYVLRPSFGFIYGFIFAATLIGFLSYRVKELKFWKALLIGLAGVVVIYVCGYIHKYVIYNYYTMENATTMKAIIVATLSFDVPKDLILCVLCSLVAKRLQNAYKMIVLKESVHA